MRIEPLLHTSFKHINPVKLPRYQKYPYGDSAPMYASMYVTCALFSVNYFTCITCTALDDR